MKLLNFLDALFFEFPSDGPSLIHFPFCLRSNLHGVNSLILLVLQILKKPLREDLNGPNLEVDLSQSLIRESHQALQVLKQHGAFVRYVVVRESVSNGSPRALAPRFWDVNISEAAVLIEVELARLDIFRPIQWLWRTCRIHVPLG